MPALNPNHAQLRYPSHTKLCAWEGILMVRAPSSWLISEEYRFSEGPASSDTCSPRLYLYERSSFVRKFLSAFHSSSYTMLLNDRSILILCFSARVSMLPKPRPKLYTGSFWYLEDPSLKMV